MSLSTIPALPLVRELLRLTILPEVYAVRFWMMHHGGLSAKPTLCYSNGPWISGLNMGKLPKNIRESNTVLKTTRCSADPFKA